MCGRNYSSTQEKACVLYFHPGSVAVSVCVSGVMFSVVAALITAVTVYLIMKKRQNKQDPVKTTPIHAPPLYDTITATSGKENIELAGNVAYQRVNL